jgi:hypothetical protein
MKRTFPAFLIAAVFVVSLGGRSAAQFETRETISTAIQGPSSVALGDFNHDGNLDLVVACYMNSSQVTVFLGNGDGTFKPPTDYEAGTSPGSVAAADLNHDGKLDLAVVGASGVAILLGKGDGSFQLASLYAIPNTPTYIAIGDFNGDHKPDLVLFAFHTVSVMLGNGDGTFQPPISFDPPYAPAALGIGDFGHNGKLDLAVGEQFGGISQVQIFSGSGDGTFQAGASYPVGAEPTSVAVADLRGNGKLDLVVSDFGDGIDVLLGNGDGTFQAAVAYPPSSNWVTVADFNGDGKPDLASVYFGTPIGAYLRLGNGDGTFGAAQYFPVGKLPVFVASGDFNGDHKPDLAIADRRFTDVDILLNTGVATFAPSTPVNFPFQLIGSTSPPQMVTLTNSGSTALTISAMKASSQFGMSSTCGSSVAPTASCAISITFSPASPGTKSGTISIVDSASSKPEVIEVSGGGTVVQLNPAALAFSDQTVGTKSPAQTVQVTNQGTQAVTMSQILVAGPDYKEFPQTNNCPSSLSAKASCTISVTFEPKKTGSRTAVIAITDNGGGSPQTVPLSGVGD